MHLLWFLSYEKPCFFGNFLWASTCKPNFIVIKLLEFLVSGRMEDHFLVFWMMFKAHYLYLIFLSRTSIIWLLPQILFSPICSLNEKPLARTLKMIYLSCASLPMQTSWNRCLYVEGASAIHPSSVAKVLQDVLLWTTFLIHQELVILVLQDCIHQYQLSFVFSGELRWLWIQSCWFQDYLVIFTW